MAILKTALKLEGCAMLRITFFFIISSCLLPKMTAALVSEGRPGVPYFGHVLFLQKKVVENDKVVSASLAYADPRDETNLCRNSIDVFGGLDRFRNIPERKWVLVDYELQSILIAEGFVGDADVFRVTVCPDVDTCLAWSESRKESPLEQQIQAERPRAKSTAKVNIENIQQRLDIGRKLVKAARCRGCHNLEGFGPAHAPSLTWKRFKYEEGWLENYLKAPYRMRPAMDDLMMLKYTSPNAQPNLKPTELDLIAHYLTNVATASAPSERYRYELWQEYDCYKCHTQFYKAKPLPFKPTPIPMSIQAKAETIPTLQSCLGCHPFGDMRTVKPLTPGAPNAFATDLLLAFEKLTLNYITSFLANPTYLEPQTRMPKPGLNDEQIDEIREFARQVKEAIASGSLKPIHVRYEMEKQFSP